jgi:hypothetical protein
MKCKVEVLLSIYLTLNYLNTKKFIGLNITTSNARAFEGFLRPLSVLSLCVCVCVCFIIIILGNKCRSRAKLTHVK